MWVFTSFGAFSVVAPKSDEGRGPTVEADKAMIRSRRRGDLEELFRRYPALAGTRIIESDHADYRWRAIVSRVVWADVMWQIATDATYTNFKSEAAAQAKGRDGRDYVHALHDVWAVMRRLQEG